MEKSLVVRCELRENQQNALQKKIIRVNDDIDVFDFVDWKINIDI